MTMAETNPASQSNKLDSISFFFLSKSEKHTSSSLVGEVVGPGFSFWTECSSIRKNCSRLPTPEYHLELRTHVSRLHYNSLQYSTNKRATPDSRKLTPNYRAGKDENLGRSTEGRVESNVLVQKLHTEVSEYPSPARMRTGFFLVERDEEDGNTRPLLTQSLATTKQQQPRIHYIHTSCQEKVRVR